MKPLRALLRIRASIRFAAPLLLALAPAAALAEPSAQGLLLVDPQGPPGAYPTIEDAVQAASDGDVIVVREGVYLSFYVDDKALSIVAAPGAWVRLTAGPRVVNLSAGKRVLLSGLHVTGTANQFLMAGNGLNLIGNEGQIRIQDCVLIGANNLHLPQNCTGIGDGNGWRGAVVTDSADVVFVGSTLSGGRGTQLDSLPCMDPFFYPAGDGGHGLHVIDSHVAFYDGFIDGGQGGTGAKGGAGGHGIRIQGASSLALYGAQVTGGAGAQSLDWVPLAGGNGGHGVADTSGPGTFSSLESPLSGGAPGFGVLGGGPGSPGQPTFGTWAEEYPAAARGFSLTIPVLVGDAAQLQFAAEPGDFVLLLVGGPSQSLPLPAFQGVLHQLQPTWIWTLGAVGPGGQAAFPLSVSQLPPGFQGVGIPLQSAFVTAALEVLLGPPRDLVLAVPGS